MKHQLLVTLCLFLSIWFFLPGEVQAKAKSYPLICRGGEAMKGSFSDVAIKFTFIGAKQSVGSRPPRAGECAWLDRGFRPGEPEDAVWNPGKPRGLRVDFEGSKMKRISTGNRRYNYLANSILNGTVFQIFAYRGKCPGLKCHYLTVTKVGPTQ